MQKPDYASTRTDPGQDRRPHIGEGRGFPGIWVIVIMFAICLAVASLSFLFIR